MVQMRNCQTVGHSCDKIRAMKAMLTVNTVNTEAMHADGEYNILPLKYLTVFTYLMMDGGPILKPAAICSEVSPGYVISRPAPVCDHVTSEPPSRVTEPMGWASSV